MRIHHYGIGAMVIATVCVLAGQVFADTSTTAAAGKARYPANESCWSLAFGSETNTCSTQEIFFVPVSIDTADTGFALSGTHAVVHSPDATSCYVECQAWTMKNDWTNVQTSYAQCSSSIGTTDLSLYGGGSTSSPAVAWVKCWANTNGRINSVYR